LTPHKQALDLLLGELRLIEARVKDTNHQVVLSKSELDVASTDFTKAKREADTLDTLKTELNKLEEYQQKFKTLADAQDSYNQAKLALQTAQHKQVTTEQECLQLQKRVADLEKEIEAVQDALKAEAGLLISVNQLSLKIKEYESYLSLDALLKSKSIEKDSAKKVLEGTELDADNKKRNALTIEKSWHLGQAAVLAAELNAGDACPVCGSNEHPNPASWSEECDVVDKGMLDTAKQASEQASRIFNDALNRFNILESEWLGLNQRAEALKLEVVDILDKPLDALKTELQDQHNALSAINAAKERLSQIEADLRGLRDQQPTLKLDNENSKQSVSDCDVQVKLTEQTLGAVFDELPEAYRDESQLKDQLDDVKKRIQFISDALNHATDNKARAISQLDKATQTEFEVSQQHRSWVEKHAQAKSSWLTFLQQSTFESEEVFFAAMMNDDQISYAQKDVDDYQNKLAHLNGSISQFSETLKGMSEPDIESILLALENKQSEAKFAEESFSEIDIKVKNLESILKQLETVHQQEAAFEAEYKVVGTLSRALSGQDGDKVNLQRFVLGMLLEDVLTQASLRLKLMSNNRYELTRKLDRAKGNAPSGLDLEVFDFHTGKARGVATLSGGESFLAALALALGLSEVVQAYSGGIKLDTLFIDEGFGSLDPESLELAIETLKQLQLSGRTIGIISHVSELKEQMGLRLDIQSSNFGSSVKLIA
jgi:exonuclease SbcC